VRFQGAWHRPFVIIPSLGTDSPSEKRRQEGRAGFGKIAGALVNGLSILVR
jgi:hypothetical protein